MTLPDTVRREKIEAFAEDLMVTVMEEMGDLTFASNIWSVLSALSAHLSERCAFPPVNYTQYTYINEFVNNILLPRVEQYSQESGESYNLVILHVYDRIYKAAQAVVTYPARLTVGQS